jgi:hypothetical protein
MFAVKSNDAYLCVQASGTPMMSHDTLTVANTAAELQEVIGMIKALHIVAPEKVKHITSYIDDLRVVPVTIGE